MIDTAVLILMVMAIQTLMIRGTQAWALTRSPTAPMHGVTWMETCLQTNPTSTSPMIVQRGTAQVGPSCLDVQTWILTGFQMS